MVRNRNRWVVTLAGAVLFLLGYAVGTGSHAVFAVGSAQGLDEALAPVAETFALIQQNYVQEVAPEMLVEGAIHGMMDALKDPFSFYMDPETYQAINEDLAGRFEGIGAVVRQDEASGGLLIVDIFPDSPAEQAGLLPGDSIVEVNGQDITDLSQGEIIGLVRGPKGSSVVLGVTRAGSPGVIRVTVTRGEIIVPNVETEVLPGDIVHARLYQFGADSARVLRERLEDLDIENRSGLILDFRGNPGGFLDTAIGVASLFVREGVIVVERGRNGEERHEALGDPVAPDVPLVVLVDAGSASASELVAGALRDLGRATVVGERTFGKGSVQIWSELTNGGGVRITSALWFTPGGDTINQVGLEPDVLVPGEPDSLEDDPQLEAAVAVLLAGDVAVPAQESNHAG